MLLQVFFSQQWLALGHEKNPELLDLVLWSFLVDGFMEGRVKRKLKRGNKITRMINHIYYICKQFLFTFFKNRGQ